MQPCMLRHTRDNGLPFLPVIALATLVIGAVYAREAQAEGRILLQRGGWQDQLVLVELAI